MPAGQSFVPTLRPKNINGRSERSIAYQSQITGLPPGLEVVFNGEHYDGCRESAGHLLEAKGEGYADKMFDAENWKPWFTGVDGLEKQLKDHSESAGNRIVEYYFAESSVAEYCRRHFNEYRNIRIYYQPFMRPR